MSQADADNESEMEVGKTGSHSDMQCLQEPVQGMQCEKESTLPRCFLRIVACEGPMALATCWSTQWRGNTAGVILNVSGAVCHLLTSSW